MGRKASTKLNADFLFVFKSRLETKSNQKGIPRNSGDNQMLSQRDKKQIGDPCSADLYLCGPRLSLITLDKHTNKGKFKLN